MNAQDVIERLCKLQEEVWNVIDPEGDTAADCFCGKGGFWGPIKGTDPSLKMTYDGSEERGYCNDLAAIEFIELATREVLEQWKVAQGRSK